MELWTLTRFAHLPQGTLGRLVRPEGAPTLFVVERPWRDNAKFESCIPDGQYELAPFSGRRHKDVLELVNVPDRSYILIHVGNSPSDVSGCLAPGVSWSIDNGGVPHVQSSRIACEQLFKDYADADNGVSLYITSAECVMPFRGDEF